jgi:hypothetical protein
MIQKFALFVAVFCLVSVMAVPMPAQSFSVKANVPFAFAVAGKTMPAGEYALDNEVPAVTAVRLRNLDSPEAAVASTNSASGGMAAHPAELVFHRYGNQYFLAQVWSGDASTGIDIQTSRDERNRAKETAGIQPQSVVILAMR